MSDLGPARRLPLRSARLGVVGEGLPQGDAECLGRGLAAVAGLMFAVKLSGGAPTIANGFLLPAIVAVLVGGTPLTGGVGGVLNTAIGTMIVASDLMKS